MGAFDLQGAMVNREAVVEHDSRRLEEGVRQSHVRGDEMRCSVSQAPPELTLENLTADTVRYLGVQPRDDEGFQVFDLEGAMIQIESECSDECQAGRIVNYRIGSR